VTSRVMRVGCPKWLKSPAISAFIKQYERVNASITCSCCLVLSLTLRTLKVTVHDGERNAEDNYMRCLIVVVTPDFEVNTQVS
jgi:hypothetical protein